MKDIKSILKEHVEGIDAEVVDKIAAEVIENYRTIDEVGKKTDRIASLEKELQERDEAIKNLDENAQELETLRDQVSKYEQAEADRIEAEQEAEKRSSFETVFNTALGERKFANSLIRETILNKAYAMCGENSAINASDAIEKLTKDEEGIWINPQTDPHSMPSDFDLGKAKDNDADTTKREFALRLFSRKE